MPKDENTNKDPNAEITYEQTATHEPRSITKKAGMAGQPADPTQVYETQSDVPENQRAENTTKSPARDPREEAPEGHPPSEEALQRNANLSNDTDAG